MKTYIIKEFGRIFPVSESHLQPGEDFENNCIYLTKKDFEQLVDITDIYQSNDNFDDPPFDHVRHAGISGIKVLNYVGLLTLPSGTSIEILPKIADSNGDIDFNRSKEILIRMLRSLKNQPFRNIGSGEMRTYSGYPLLEIFISSFIGQCQEVLRVNFRSGYSMVDENERFLRGKVSITKNMRVNLWRKDRFWCVYEEFTKNVPQNRVLKTAADYLAKKTRSSKNFSNLQMIIQHMEDVDVCSDVKEDLRLSFQPNRLFAHYHDALATASVFLAERSFTALKGESRSFSLLYPMEIVFQNYVAEQFKKHAGMNVILQHNEHHLVDEHKGGQLFKLRPDIFMENGDFYAVLDTKWKRVKGSGSKSYNIKESDMYQMFAYAMKYSTSLNSQTEDPRTENRISFAFIYPAHEGFKESLAPFYFFKFGLHVKVLPFNLLADPGEEVETIVAALYS